MARPALLALGACQTPTPREQDWRGQIRETLFVSELPPLDAGSHGTFEVVPGASHRPFFVTRPVALWLERHLDLPEWNEASLRDMPETLIGTWAEGRNVIDRTYNTVHREAGTRALGSGVPHLSREPLGVFSREDWERGRLGMIHESWLERARAAVAGRN